MGMYGQWIRRALFGMPAEAVHAATVEACHWAGRVPGLGRVCQARFGRHYPELASEVAGIHFPNPIGLAAGWDKNARGLPLLYQLGFGFVEIGSVSADPSQGNPRPRLFRLPSDRGIIVNYGLPNRGAAVIVRRLARYPRPIPVGVNIVATNRGHAAPACQPQEILDDYARSLKCLGPHASYVMLNLSCPNTLDGQDFFATAGRIRQLLQDLQHVRSSERHWQCPLFLKVPPSQRPQDHDRLLEEVADYDFVRGFMFNLAAGKPDWLQLQTPSARWRHLPGAVAGAPVATYMDACIAGLYARMDRQRYAIIGGGGVFTADDAWRKLGLGASLVEIYTALVYEGPSLIGRLQDGLAQRLQQHGWQRLSQAVGHLVK